MDPSSRLASELRGKLLWIVTFRAIILATLLALAAALQTEQMARSVGLLWAGLYGLSLANLLITRFLANAVGAFYLQMLFDVVFITLLIYHSADFNSIFVPLYLLVIVYASALDQRRGGMWAMGLSMISYLGVIGLSYFSPATQQTSAPWVQENALRLALNLMAFVAVGYLGIYLSKRLHSMRVELGKREDSLAELQALHRNIVNSIRSGLFTTDLQGRVTSFNPAAEEITGHQQAGILGRPCSVVVGQTGMRRLLRTDFTRLKRALRSEIWTRDAAGRWRYIGFSASPLLSQSEKILGFTISFQDLTGIKKLEEEVQLKDRMATIGNLVAGIAHELRNPLGSIAGSVQVLKSDLQAEGDRARLLDVVLRESARLNKIIEDLLSYAKPKDRPLDRVALDRVLDETLQLARNDRLFLTHTIVVEKPENLPPCVADPDQMKQVFWNLITNAARAMPRGGDLTIRMTPGRHYLRIAFRDRGVGMTREERRRLFQPFSGGFAGGVGLGMAIVYQIIQRHQGKIAVHSRRNLGTTITVALPLVHSKASESPVSQSDVAGNGRRDSATAPRASGSSRSVPEPQ
ncbi:MAG: PAS domain S-box protein [Acidobacteria bacterium]|nr:PAS domain S-box protein [Acidobacteriota bacterium]